MINQYVACLEMGARQYLRNSMFLALLLLMPPAFITLSFIVTPDTPIPLQLIEAGQRFSALEGMPEIHGALMVPMTAAFLSGFIGLFVMYSAREGDRRLVIAGYRPVTLLAVRTTMIISLSLAITILSVGITLISFWPEQLGWFFAINFASALMYAFLGAIAGTFLSAISGTYLMFFTPMIDIGLVQDPMFPRQSVEWWAKLLPGYAPMEVLMDASFTSSFDTIGFLAYSVVYTFALGLAATALFVRLTSARR